MFGSSFNTASVLYSGFAHLTQTKTLLVSSVASKHRWMFKSPSPVQQAQLSRAREVAADARRRLRGRMEVLFVTPDYYTDLPKACMDGWGQRFIIVSPDGLALPCHAAHTLPGLHFDSVRDRPLDEIWRDSPGFRAFRGEDWMPEPCRSCERRAIDFGGCRCQAFHLTGNAAATDPTCHLSPDHGLIETARLEAAETPPAPFIYRTTRARVVG